MTPDLVDYLRGRLADLVFLVSFLQSLEQKINKIYIYIYIYIYYYYYSRSDLDISSISRNIISSLSVPFLPIFFARFFSFQTQVLFIFRLSTSLDLILKSNLPASITFAPWFLFPDQFCLFFGYLHP